MSISGTLILDSEGLSKAVRRDRELMEWLAAARAADIRVVTSSVTLVEVAHPAINRAAFDWTVSRLSVAPVDEGIARTAARLLVDAGLHGHKYVIDAVVAATAQIATKPATILTSDPDDM